MGGINDMPDRAQGEDSAQPRSIAIQLTIDKDRQNPCQRVLGNAAEGPECGGCGFVTFGVTF